MGLRRRGSGVGFEFWIWVCGFGFGVSGIGVHLPWGRAVPNLSLSTPEAHLIQDLGFGVWGLGFRV